MKRMSLFIACSLLLQSFAWAGPKESLKSVMDEYRYAVTVEWDQKNLVQLEEFKANFSAELKKLVVEEKLSAAELQDFIKSNSRDLQVDANILETIKDQNGELNLERAQQMLEKSSSEIYMQGSSWAPLEILKYGLITLAVFEIAVLIIGAGYNDCPTSQSHDYNEVYACEYED